MAAPSVPLPHNYALGMSDEGVVAIKRALSRAGFLEWQAPFTKTYGPFCRKAVHAFQKAHGISIAGYGAKTHHALLNTHKKGSKEWAFDKIAIQLMTDEYERTHISPETRIRTLILKEAQRLYGFRMQIGYAQYRPFPLLHLDSPPPHTLDCSGFVSVCWYAAGARNPNGRAWDGQGYTGTLLSAARKCSKDELKIGDPVFYGFTTSPSPAFPYGSPTHVALWDGEGGVFSMGHYPMGHYVYDYGQRINCFATYDHVAP